MKNDEFDSGQTQVGSDAVLAEFRRIGNEIFQLSQRDGICPSVLILIDNLREDLRDARVEQQFVSANDETLATGGAAMRSDEAGELSNPK